jgi:hypothetical protein
VSSNPSGVCERTVRVRRGCRDGWKAATLLVAWWLTPAAGWAQVPAEDAGSSYVQPAKPARLSPGFDSSKPLKTDDIIEWRSSGDAPLDMGPYQPLTGEERVSWFIKSTVGPMATVAGVFSAGIETARDVPEEYGPGWKGFGKRYALRLSGVAISSGVEDTLGAAWGEDPRYFRVPDEKFSDRVRSVVKQAFYTRRTDGTYGLAYARFVAVPTSSFLTNEWRPPSQNDTRSATLRVGYSFGWRIGSNAIREFLPDLTNRVFHRNP